MAAGPAGAYTIVRLAGEHDLTTADAVRAAFAAVPAPGGLVVDLCTCTFADSSIISALLHARRERPSFAVVLPDDPQGTIARALTITGVASLLRCCTSLEEAVGRLAEGDGDRDPPGGRDAAARRDG